MSSDAESTIVRATHITPNGRPYTAPRCWLTSKRHRCISFTY